MFRAYIISKLIYGIETLCLKKADRDKLDAFHVQCLRQVLGIPHSMVSRVSNAEVRRRAHEVALSQTVFFRQLLSFGRIAAMPDSLFRRTIFSAGSVEPASSHAPRRRGRPRLTWGSLVRAHAFSAIRGLSPPPLPRPPPPPLALPLPAPAPQESDLFQFLSPGHYNPHVWRTIASRYTFS